MLHAELPRQRWPAAVCAVVLAGSTELAAVQRHLASVVIPGADLLVAVRDLARRGRFDYLLKNQATSRAHEG